MDNQIDALDRRVSKALSTESAKINTIQEVVRDLQDAMHILRNKSSTIFDKSSHDLGIVQNSFMAEIQTMTQQRRDTDARLLREADRPFSELWKILNESVKARQASQDRFNNTTGRELKTISSSIAEIAHVRESKGIRVSKSINAELDKIKTDIESFTTKRGSQETAILQLLESFVASVQHDLQKERNERESIENQLLKLLEETCSRVERAFDAAQARKAGRGAEDGLESKVATNNGVWIDSKNFSGRSASAVTSASPIRESFQRDDRMQNNVNNNFGYSDQQIAINRSLDDLRLGMAAIHNNRQQNSSNVNSNYRVQNEQSKSSIKVKVDSQTEGNDVISNIRSGSLLGRN
eukprot:GDKJ01050551.1.p1 GENE.GDKJ01050551.1~~GDKJ01050551.1.p1  ORF type:complete len:401 (+),score=69.20 GDKJ01050551.1:148-1203(+)